VAAVKVKFDASGWKMPSRMTIIHQLLNPAAAEGHKRPSDKEIVGESFTTVGAASDTTGNAMTISTYHVLSNEEIHSKLTVELKEAFPDPSSRLDFTKLEKLPYLVTKYLHYTSPTNLTNFTDRGH
jgi:cytochrome P450